MSIHLGHIGGSKDLNDVYTDLGLVMIEALHGFNKEENLAMTVEIEVVVRRCY